MVKTGMAKTGDQRWDLTTRGGRMAARVNFFLADFGFFRQFLPNRFEIGTGFFRSAQPWPYQLKRWKEQGIRTVINLRGEEHGGHDALEREACERLGIELIDFRLWSRKPPTREMVEEAVRLFDTVEYPILVHCKSGADRAGLMSVLYRHLKLGEPIRDAMTELSWRRGHANVGNTGVLDHFLERYLAEGEPRGLTLLEWVRQPGYSADALNDEYRRKPRFWGNFLVDVILRRG